MQVTDRQVFSKYDRIQSSVKTRGMLKVMLCGSATPEAKYTDFWERRYQAILAATPKFGEEQ